jgi:DNA-binding Xre family transcriptional regulator
MYFSRIRRDAMAVSYRKLRYLLVDKKISMAKLVRMSGISDYSARLLGKDKDVSTEVLTKVCTALDCEVQDIVDFLPENTEQ